MENLDPLTFDLGEALAGRTYPTSEVTVYLDEEKAYEIYALNQKIRVLEAAGEDTEVYHKQIEDLRKFVVGSAITVHLRGLDPEEDRLLKESALKEFPIKKDALGREVPVPERDDFFLNSYWKAAITKIVLPNGSSTEDVQTEHVRMLRNKLPVYGVTEIDKAMRELASGAAEGFKTIIADTDFLSRP